MREGGRCQGAKEGAMMIPQFRTAPCNARSSYLKSTQDIPTIANFLRNFRTVMNPREGEFQKL
jgi:hypothetical protein